MNSFELNKVLGAILGTCLITLALNIGAGAIFAPEKPAKPGYAIAVKELGAAEPSAGKKEPEEPMEAMMASASVEKGQADRQAMPGLPYLREGRPQPGRPQSVGHRRPAARLRGGLQLFRRHEGQRRHLDLRRALRVPGQSARLYPGTAMTFAGLARGQQRADVIDFLHTLSDSPMPLPKAAENAPAAAAPAAPAEAPKAEAAPAAPAAPAK